ncbi:MAG TPA: helix-turn-helix transcriptional regulator [Gammaproteobacteria bacterium]
MLRVVIIASMVTNPVAQPVGKLLKEWRMRRRLSQLELALEAETSPRHLSFIETGRSTPSREMLLRLAERLDVPLRERNRLLVAAGYAPRFPERRLDDGELAAAQRVVELVLKGHEPFPALAVDRHWNLVARNDAVPPLLAGVDPALLESPVNVLKLSLHPQGLAPRIANLAEWREHLLDRLRKQIEATADSVLAALFAELESYPAPPDAGHESTIAQYGGIAVPLRLAVDGGELAFYSTTTVFGTPLDVTLSELAIEAFFPADERTAAALRKKT